MIHNIDSHETWNVETSNRKRVEIFIEMSRLMQTRSPEQCRSFDQKMRSKQYDQIRSVKNTPTSRKGKLLTQDTQDLQEAKISELQIVPTLSEGASTNVPSDSPNSVNTAQDLSGLSPIKEFNENDIDVYFADYQISTPEAIRSETKKVTVNSRKTQRVKKTKAESRRKSQ